MFKVLIIVTAVLLFASAVKILPRKYYLSGQSKFIKKQKMFFHFVPHEGTLRSAIIWWLRHKNIHCRSFCPTCEYYYRCQEDVAFETYIGEE